MSKLFESRFADIQVKGYTEFGDMWPGVNAFVAGVISKALPTVDLKMPKNQALIALVIYTTLRFAEALLNKQKEITNASKPRQTDASQPADVPAVPGDRPGESV